MSKRPRTRERIMNKMGFKLLLVLSAVALIYLLGSMREKQGADVKQIRQQASTELQYSHEQTQAFVEPQSAKVLSYRFVIESTMLDEQGKLLGGSTFSGELGLKAADNGHTWYGQMVNGNIKQHVLQQGNSQHSYEQGIVFTTDYQDAVFSQVDMLGLAASHPGQALKYMLAQLSYKKDGPLSIDLANSSHDYLYQQSGNQITRTLQQKNVKQTNLDMELTDSLENWLLTVKQHLPVRMEYDNRLNYQNDNGTLLLNQQMLIEATEQTFDWSMARFAANANSLLASPQLQMTPQFTINNQQQLLAALAQLAESNDSELAKAIGAYLVEHYSAGQLAQWLGEFTIDSREPSLLIYAVQKSGGYPAELLLSQLYQQQQLSRLNKQRVLMSMGRFEGGSEHTLNSLRQISAQDEKIYADTALLSIGSLAKFGDSLQGPVADILAARLAQPDSEALAIIAINNSGLEQFDDQVAGYLGHENSRVNVAAIKLLAKKPSYRDFLVDYVTQHRNPQSITALRTSLAKQGAILSQSQKARISAQARQISHPVIKQQLLALLNMEKGWDG